MNVILLIQGTGQHRIIPAAHLAALLERGATVTKTKAALLRDEGKLSECSVEAYRADVADSLALWLKRECNLPGGAQ